jgi:uncharacterized protein YaaW (UPF0174 family)
MPFIQSLIRLGGFFPYKLAVIVANGIAKALLGRGLCLAAGAALPRSMAIFTGPTGWAITGIWTIFDIAKPAYRVTIPCVLHIAMLRLKYMLQEQEVDLLEGLPGGIANKMPEGLVSV